jgi:hypothetical protein
MVKLLKLLCGINSIVFLAYAIRIVFFSYELQKFDAIFACIMTALFSFSLAIANIEVARDDN